MLLCFYACMLGVVRGDSIPTGAPDFCFSVAIQCYNTILTGSRKLESRLLNDDMDLPALSAGAPASAATTASSTGARSARKTSERDVVDASL